MYAPIIIFVYNRADRVEKLISSLTSCPEAGSSDLFVFSDGSKNPNNDSKVQAVREYIDSIPALSAFKSVTIKKEKKNKGLAASVIDGVSSVINKYGKAIIIEDDNIVAPDFLDYMNRGLDFYRDDSKVWAISGFSRKMPFPSDYAHDVFMMQRMSSYTWATWKDRWEKADWDIEKYYPAFLFDRKARRQFALCGEDRPLMLDAQMCGTISSWAIQFEYSMVRNNMYSIIPCLSRAVCNGNDGSGTHSSVEVHSFDTDMSDGSQKVRFEQVEQDERIRREFIKPYRNNLKRRLLRNIDFIILYFRNSGKNRRRRG